MGALKYPILEQSCLMVAASNAPDDKKHAAHYVCDGVDDQVQIQQAIDMIETLGNGGVVLLTEGVFEIDPSVGIRGVDGLVLQGSGASLGTNGTVLYVSAGTGTLFSLKQADANAGVRVHLKDLAFKGYAVDETIDLCGLDCAGMKVAKIENVFFTLFPKAIYAHGGQFYSGTPVTHVCNEIFFDVWMISVGRGFYALGKNGCNHMGTIKMTWYNDYGIKLDGDPACPSLNNGLCRFYNTVVKGYTGGGTGYPIHITANSQGNLFYNSNIELETIKIESPYNLLHGGTFFGIIMEINRGSSVMGQRVNNQPNRTFINLIDNGDFENGDPPFRWTSFSSTISSETGAGNVHRGNRSMKIHSPTANGQRALQNIKNWEHLKGKYVYVRVWAKCLNNTRDQRIRLTHSGATPITGTDVLPKDSTWHEYHLMGFIPLAATNVNVSFYISDDGGYSGTDVLYVDELMVVEGVFCPEYQDNPEPLECSPASGEAGKKGTLGYDANYLYICNATDVWERVATTGGY